MPNTWPQNLLIVCWSVWLSPWRLCEPTEEEGEGRAMAPPLKYRIKVGGSGRDPPKGGSVVPPPGGPKNRGLKFPPAKRNKKYLPAFGRIQGAGGAGTTHPSPHPPGCSPTLKRKPARIMSPPSWVKTVVRIVGHPLCELFLELTPLGPNNVSRGSLSYVPNRRPVIWEIRGPNRGPLGGAALAEGPSLDQGLS